MNQRELLEQLPPTHTPTPKQLFKLGSIGMTAAARQNKIRTLKTVSKAHFFIEEVSHLNDTLTEEASFIRHRMAGRIGRKAATEAVLPTWSLKFFDAYWVEHDKGIWRAESTRYRFEWNRNNTLLAERQIRLLQPDIAVEEPNDIPDLIDNFSFADDEDVIWHTREQLGAVTQDDCDLLIADAQKYYDAVLLANTRAA